MISSSSAVASASATSQAAVENATNHNHDVEDDDQDELTDRQQVSETTWSSPVHSSSGDDALQQSTLRHEDGGSPRRYHNRQLWTTTGGDLEVRAATTDKGHWKNVISPILQKMMRIFGNNFVLAFNVRAGVAIAERLISVLRKWISTGGITLNLEELVDEKHVRVRVSAFRWALFIASFSSSYYALRELLLHLFQWLRKYWKFKRMSREPTNETDNPASSMFGGENKMATRLRKCSVLAAVCASTSLCWLEKETRRNLSLYAMARACQTLYNVSKTRGWVWHWQPLKDNCALGDDASRTYGDWLGGHGDLLLFSLGSAQVMYAFILYAGALPKSYEKFILQTGPIRTPAVSAVRDSLQYGKVKVNETIAYCIKNRPDWLDVFGKDGKFRWKYEIYRGLLELLRSCGIPVSEHRLRTSGSSINIERSKLPWPIDGEWMDLSMIPSSIAHPRQSILLFQWLQTFIDAFRRSFPLYASINFVTPLVLRLRYVSQRPLKWFIDSLLGSLRSTTFLGAFVAIYMACFDIHRLCANHENRAIYGVGGFFAGLSLLIEKKDRRAELALYVLPRAIDALWKIMKKKRLMESLRFGEVALFAGSMAVLLSSMEIESNTVTKPVRWTIQRFIPTHLSLAD